MVNKITKLILVSFILMLTLFVGCSSNQNESAITPEIEIDNDNNAVVEETENSIDETMDSELISEDEEVEIGELI